MSHVIIQSIIFGKSIRTITIYYWVITFLIKLPLNKILCILIKLCLRYIRRKLLFFIQAIMYIFNFNIR